MTEKQRSCYASVWDAIADTPQEASNLKLRSQAMDALIRRIKAENWTQTEAAQHLGVTQPRVSDLYRGKFSQFSLDALVNMLIQLGDDVEMVIKHRAPVPGASGHRPSATSAVPGHHH